MSEEYFIGWAQNSQISAIIFSFFTQNFSSLISIGTEINEISFCSLSNEKSHKQPDFIVQSPTRNQLIMTHMIDPIAINNLAYPELTIKLIFKQQLTI